MDPMMPKGSFILGYGLQTLVRQHTGSLRWEGRRV